MKDSLLIYAISSFILVLKRVNESSIPFPDCIVDLLTMYNSTWMLALLAPSLVLSARMRRTITDEEAVTVDQMMEVRICYIYFMIGYYCLNIFISESAQHCEG